MDVITFPENLLTTSGLSIYFTPRRDFIWWNELLVRNDAPDEWRQVDDGPPTVVFESTPPPPHPTHQIKKKRCRSWTPSDKTFSIRACKQYLAFDSSLADCNIVPE